jgi:hypothetical protein
MPSSYPGGLDTFASTSPANTGQADTTGRTQSQRFHDMGAAIMAIQAELGVNPSGSASTVVERLDATGSSLPDVFLLMGA